jgi:ribosome-binding protein aMBF1 (putative translation factor)
VSGHKSFKNLSAPINADPERRARVEQISREYDAILALADLREALGVTQAELAKVLEVSQPRVSRLEHKEDVYLSTLENYIEALGGHLKLEAVFEDRSIELTLPRA